MFFITSADSATYVLGMISGNGNLNPSNRIKIMWGLIVAGSSIVFLLAGGLEAVRTLSIVVASPFTLLMVIICYTILKALKKDRLEMLDEMEDTNESSDESISSSIPKKKSS
jgi:glycine betaine transporter